VVVGQESGLAATHGHHKEHRVSLRERYEVIYGKSGMQRRYYGDSEHAARNPHMRGTTSALRVLFGNGIGADWDGE